MLHSPRPSTPAVIAIVALWASGLAMVERSWLATGDDQRFVFLQPSPLWLVVAWVALRVGVRAGVISGLLVGVWHALGSSAGGWHAGLRAHGDIWWSMAMFAVVALLIGWQRGAATLRASVAVECTDEPVRQFVAPVDTGGEQEAIDGALETLMTAYGALRCSLLQVLPDGLVDFAVHRGWADDDVVRRSRDVADDQVVAAAIIKASLVVHTAAHANGDARPHRPLMVAPIQEADGVVRMLLCIDELAPGRGLEQATAGLQSVVDWLGPRLRHSVVEASVAPDCRSVLRMLQTKNPIGTTAQLSERIFLEDARSRRYGLTSTIIAVRVPSLRSRSVTSQQEEPVREAFADVLRQTDDAYRFGYTGFYVLVLVGRAVEDANVFEQRLLRRFAGAEMRGVTSKVFAPDELAPNLESLLPRLTNWFFGRTDTGGPMPCPVPPPRPRRRGDLAAFLIRLRLELGLSRRLDSGLSLIEFRGQPGDAAIAPMVARHLSNLADRPLRPTDGIYVLSPERCVVVLPNTDCLDAVTVWRRLDDDLAASLPAGHHQRIESQSISMRDADAQNVIMHLLGQPEHRRDESILTEEELSHLAEQFAGPIG